MKTTLILDDDVCGGAFAASTQLRQPFQVVINEALRAGLAVLAASKVSPPERSEHADRTADQRTRAES
jgi:hypothetical protein